ncbi:MAG: protein jag [Tissierellia bacterium]|nr:protein jag [Tissierellia bacterium]
MRSVVKVSKTVDEAVRIALEELDVTERDIHIEVLEEPSRGLFGLIGSKDATVKVTVVNDPVEKAQNFIDDLLSSMNIKGSCSIKKEGLCLNIDIINVNSSDMGIIIGKRGNTLDAIQFLTSLTINKDRDDYIKVLIDIKGYRKRREETLIRLANRMGRKAKYSEKPVKLEPMNPYERRIIHSALQYEDGISTYSEGEEPYRRVVIQAK